MCTLDKREQVQYLPREGPAPAGTRASRRCGQERAAAASPTRTGELPPAGCSHLPPWAAFPPPDAWHRQHPYVVRGLDPGQRSPRLPLSLLPCLGEQGQGQAPAGARQGEERGRVPWEAWRREHQGRAVPKGRRGRASPRCHLCARRRANTRPRHPSPGQARREGAGHDQAGRLPPAGPWVRGAGCVGLGACPGGWVRARGSALGDGAGWGGWRVLTGTSWQQPPCLEAVLAGAEAGLCLTPGYCPGPTAGACPQLGPSRCPGAGLLPCPPWEAAGLILQLGGCLPGTFPSAAAKGRPLPLSRAEPCSVPGPGLLPPVPAPAPARGTWPELHQAQVPLPPPRPQRAAGPGRRPAPSWEAAATPRPTRDSPADGRGRCTSARGREGGREGCEQPLGALLYARVIYTCMLTIQEGL